MARGLLRDRFIPRLLGASPDALLDQQGLIDPDAAVAALMKNEKDGGTENGRAQWV